MPPSLTLLFVYGTLRRRSDAPMAAELRRRARWIGAAEARGTLYHLAGYPGFVPDAAGGPVRGDLFAMDDPVTLLALLDDYEECSARFPEPREYRRIVVPVRASAGTVEAWTYAYAWPVRAEDRIEGGDFLA